MPGSRHVSCLSEDRSRVLTIVQCLKTAVSRFQSSFVAVDGRKAIPVSVTPSWPEVI